MYAGYDRGVGDVVLGHNLAMPVGMELVHHHPVVTSHVRELFGRRLAQRLDRARGLHGLHRVTDIREQHRHRYRHSGFGTFEFYDN